MRGKEKAMARIKSKRHKSMAQCGIFLAAVVMLITILSPLQLGNPYLQSSTFEKVTVRRHENVWVIASRYTQDNEQLQGLVKAIIEINALPNDAEIKTGQELQIPLLKPVQDGLARMAEK